MADDEKPREGLTKREELRSDPIAFAREFFGGITPWQENVMARLMDPNIPRPGHGVDERWRPFTYRNAAAMLTYALVERGGVSPAVWYISRECAEELIPTVSRAMHYGDGKPLSMEHFESGALRIMGVPILPAYITRRTTEGGFTEVASFTPMPKVTEADIKAGYELVCGIDTAYGPGDAVATTPEPSRQIGNTSVSMEWLKTDEIPVTAEMVEAGVTAMWAHDDFDGDDNSEVTAVYRAMRALEPMKVTPDSWSDDAIRKVITQRDEAFDRIEVLEKERAELHDGQDRLQRLYGDRAVIAITAQKQRDEACALLKAHGIDPPDHVITQTTTGDTTYTVFSNDPNTIVADRNHTAADVKPPAPVKEFPAGALKVKPGDPRRIGG
jgi:hypothetical protein